MNIRRTAGRTAALLVWLAPALHAGHSCRAATTPGEQRPLRPCFAWCPSGARAAAAAPTPDLVPQTQTLAFPVAVAGSSRRKVPAVECVVSCGPPVPISAVAFSPDGKTLAVGGYREVLIWDLAEPKLSRRIPVEESSGPVHALTFLRDSQFLAVGAGSPYGAGAVKIVNVETGESTVTFREPKDVVYCLAVSPDGKFLAAGGADTAVEVWNIGEQKVAATLAEHNDWVLGVTFSPDGKFLATASADRTVKVWEVGQWKPVVRLLHDDTCRAVAFAPDGRNPASHGALAVAVGGPRQWSVQLRRINNLRYSRSIFTDGGMPLDIVRAAKTGTIFAACSDNTVKSFNAAGRRMTSYRGHRDWVYSVALSPDETKLASGSADGTVKLWKVADGSLLATLVQLSPRTDEWLMVTAQGYLATSAAGALKWKAPKSIPAKKLAEVLQNPEFVRKAIAGENTPPPALPPAE